MTKVSTAMDSNEEAAQRARIARALELLDAGEVADAREELRNALLAASAEEASVVADGDTPVPVQPYDPVLAAGEIGDGEIDEAFALAETDPDEMMSANKVVEETLEAPDLGGPEALLDIANRPTYATRSMAALLEDQGRRSEASAVRASLPDPLSSSLSNPLSNSLSNSLSNDASASQAAEAGFLTESDAERLQIIATLESWLHNVRTGMTRDATQRDAAPGHWQGGMS